MLGDIPGAGKTCISIRAALEAGAERVLVLTKKTLIHHWLHEIARWGGGTAEAYSTKSKGVPQTSFVVTNYEVVARRLEGLLAAQFDAVIIDECTAIKGRKTQRTKAVYKLCHAEHTNYVWLLTGTPIHNRPDELWSLLHALDKKTFSSYWRFVGNYCVVSITKWGRKVEGPRNLESLRLLTEKYILRRDAAMLGIQMPDITEENIYLEMTPRQEELYRSMEKEFTANPAFSVLSGEPLWASSFVAQLVRLRQIACSPVLIEDTDEGAKTEALVDFFEENLPYSKVLVFSSFAKYINILAKKFAAYNPVCITGTVNNAQRQAAVNTFNNDNKCRLLLGTTRAMGEGLNLQTADIVLYSDLDWSPAMIEQATARTYRRGREAPVRVVRLIATHTIDEYIAEVLSNKNRTLRAMDNLVFIAKKIYNRKK